MVYREESESIIMEDETKGKSYTIFVVEDSDIYRMVLQRFLSKMTNADLTNKPDCEILSFATGEECMEVMKKKRPDIVIMDYYLNDGRNSKMDGIQLLKEIKKTSPSTEVLVLSRQEDVLITAELFNQGASAYISKEPHGQNRVQNIVLETIRKLEKQKKEKRNRVYLMVLAFIMGIAVGVILMSGS